MKRIAVFFSLVALLSGCDFQGLNQTGSLFFDLEGTQSRLIGPEIDLDADHFVISGVGPGDSAFTLDTSVEEPLLEDLRVGLWDITGQVFNVDGELIGSGPATANVTPGGYTAVFIPFDVLPGMGNLSISLSWEVDTLFNPRIAASIEPVGERGYFIEFEPADEGIPETETYLFETELETGYYLLKIEVFDRFSETDEETKVAGGSELVRILADQDSIGYISLNNLNSLQGSFGFLFEWNPQNTVNLEMTSSPEPSGEILEWYLDQAPQVTITAEPRGQSYTVDWYLDGELFAPDYILADDPGPDFYAGAEVTLDMEEIGLGYHRMDVIMIFADGIIGMIGFDFLVVEATP